jgi:tetratricopeptide (TPR) repeat protein
MNRILVIFIALFSITQVWAQQEGPDLRRGNNEYKHENYTEAEVNYRRGLDKNNDSFEGHFNLGDALFRQEKYPEALEQYQKAESLLKGDDKTRKAELDRRLAATYHNMGNALYAQQQYDKSVAAYQQSLRHNPKDNDTRYNLVKAMQQLQQQQQNQNQQQNQEQKNDSTQQQPQEQQQQEQQNQQQEQNQDQMDRETAEQILQALEQDEQETQEKLQRQQGKKRRVEKNW